jgi:hypothetical protein
VRLLGLIFAGSATTQRAEMKRVSSRRARAGAGRRCGHRGGSVQASNGSRFAVAGIGGLGETSRSIGFLLSGLDEAAARLRGAGIDVGEPATNERHRYVHFRAPDVQLYELVEEC